MGTIVLRAGKKGTSFEAQAKRTDPISGKMVRKALTFKTEREAKDWLAEFETEILKSKVKEEKTGEILFKDAISDFIKKKLGVNCHKVSKEDDINRLNKWKESKYADYPLPLLTYKVFMGYIDSRRFEKNRSGEPIAEQTIKHELQVVSNLFNWLMIDHEDLINPIKRIPSEYKPHGSREVDVRIPSDKQTLLLAGLTNYKATNPKKTNNLKKDNKLIGQRKLYPVIAELGITTAMRQGEMLRLKKKDMHFTSPIHAIATDFRTKKGITTIHTRIVPLYDRAFELLEFAKDIEDDNALIFGDDFDELKLSTAFTEVSRSISLFDTDGHPATFHSTRHEAISRMVEAGMSRENIMKISGHATASQLDRYFNARAEGLSKAISVLNKPVAIEPADA